MLEKVKVKKGKNWFHMTRSTFLSDLIFKKYEYRLINTGF